VLVSQIFVGPPPESAAAAGPHNQGTIVVVSNLPFTTTDASLKKDCLEVLGVRPKFVYMHVADRKTGMFSGTAVVEFPDAASAAKAVSTRVHACPTRLASAQEFESLTAGDWPMLEYGPPQGVFGEQPKAAATPQPAWAQSLRAPSSNPWQR
jgi:hypothetical protein